MKLIQRILLAVIVLISIQLIVGQRLRQKLRYINEDEWEEEFVDSDEFSDEDIDVVGRPQPCDEHLVEVILICIFGLVWFGFCCNFSFYLGVIFSASLSGSQILITSAVRVLNANS